MTRYDQYGPLDTQPQLAGDRHFVGVNMRLEPHLLPPGYVSNAVNMRFRNGVAETRAGFIVPTWANKIVAGSVQPWGEIHGVGEFSDPITLGRYLIIAADGGVWATQVHNAPVQLTLPAGETLTGTVSFTQAFNTLILHRGADAATLVLEDVATGFLFVEQTSSGNGTQPIPDATHSVFMQNRLVIPNDNDEIAFSDLADYTRYVPIAQEFKVNQGSADAIVGIYKYNEITLVAFKEHSIYLLNNIYGDLSAAQQDELTNQFGLVARQSVAQVGKDLWFLSELGVMSLTQTEQGKIQGVQLPVSDPIQPLIDRINWRYASGAVSAYYDNRYYLAVPLDDAEVTGPQIMPPAVFAPIATFSPAVPKSYVMTVTAGKTYRFEPAISLAGPFGLINGAETYQSSKEFVAVGTTVTLSLSQPLVTSQAGTSLKEVQRGLNTAVVVYDFLNQSWSGYDEISVSNFTQSTVNGRRRLMAFGVNGYVTLWEEDIEEALTQPYTDVIVSGTPANGNTIAVNGGGTITVDPAQTATTWDGTAGRLYIDGTTTGYANLQGNWTSPGATASQITNGVRFTSTTGIIPEITTTGSWATVIEVNTRPIASSLSTRGYQSEGGGLQDFRHVVMDVQTWAPETTVEVVTSGVNEETTIIDAQTRDRTAYYEPSDASAFSLDNANGDFLTPYRKDYSVKFGTETGDTDELALHTTSGGIPLERHQETRITESISIKGRSAQIVFTNTQGRLRIMSAGFEAEERQLHPSTKA